MSINRTMELTDEYKKIEKKSKSYKSSFWVTVIKSPVNFIGDLMIGYGIFFSSLFSIIFGFRLLDINSIENFESFRFILSYIAIFSVFGGFLYSVFKQYKRFNYLDSIAEHKAWNSANKKVEYEMMVKLVENTVDQRFKQFNDTK